MQGPKKKVNYGWTGWTQVRDFNHELGLPRIVRPSSIFFCPFPVGYAVPAKYFIPGSILLPCPDICAAPQHSPIEIGVGRKKDYFFYPVKAGITRYWSVRTR